MESHMSKRPSCLKVPQFPISLSLSLSLSIPSLGVCLSVCPSPGKCIVIRNAKAWPQTASTTINKPQNILSLQQQATPTSKRDAGSHDPTYHWTASAQSPVWPQAFYSFEPQPLTLEQAFLFLSYPCMDITALMRMARNVN